MTLNDRERRNSPYFAFLPNSTDFQAHYITVAEDIPIMSGHYRSIFNHCGIYIIGLKIYRIR